MTSNNTNKIMHSKSSTGNHIYTYTYIYLYTQFTIYIVHYLILYIYHIYMPEVVNLLYDDIYEAAT